jgi:hypothetical protein
MSDGKLVAVANPNGKAQLGMDVRTVKDSTGDEFGQRLYDAAE